MKKIILLFVILITNSALFARTETNVDTVKKVDFFAELLYLQPRGNPDIYAVMVSGVQPFNPSWTDHIIKMSYSPGFEVGVGYRPTTHPEKIALSWMHLNVSNSQTINVPTGLTSYPNGETNYYFVAPIYDMGPGTFGIKSATGLNILDFERVSLDIEKIYKKNRKLFKIPFKIDFFGGLDFLRIGQTSSSTFFNNQGFPATPLSYANSPDPGYTFTDKVTSQYLGVGPKLGMNLTYGAHNGLQILSKSTFSLSGGSISSQDNFSGTSGINPYVGSQSLSMPGKQAIIVPGFETKLGVGYNNTWLQKYHLDIQAGYRIASYMGSIWMVKPSSLVLPGADYVNGPEVATANMNIRTQVYEQSNFTWNGPYLNFSLKL